MRQLASSAVPVRNLSDLAKGAVAVVDHILHTGENDPISHRLADLGFVPGEPVRVVAFGPFGADPVLIVVGSTRFALRRSEAARVAVREVSHYG